MRGQPLGEELIVEIRMMRFSGIKVGQILEHLEMNYDQSGARGTGLTMSRPHLYRITTGQNYAEFGGPRVTATQKRFIRKLQQAAA